MGQTLEIFPFFPEISLVHPTLTFILPLSFHSPAPFALYSHGNNEVGTRGHSSRKKSGTRDEDVAEGSASKHNICCFFIARPLKNDSTSFRVLDRWY